MTDATLSGGNSGGRAIDAEGKLIGVPTQGSALDCLPLTLNQDSWAHESTMGCVPAGGSIGKIRPINVALPLFYNAGLGRRDRP